MSDKLFSRKPITRQSSHFEPPQSNLPHHSSKTPLSEKTKKTAKALFLKFFQLGLFIVLCGFLWIGYTISTTPDIETLSANSFSQPSVILDNSGGTVLYELVGKERRDVVALNDISIHMQHAILAAEDADFYNHGGVSYRGIARAVRDAFIAGRTEGGASTITQQLVKMVVFSKGEESFHEKLQRKIREISLAIEVEKTYDKNQILELYLNKVPFRGNIYGVERASQEFFGKNAKDLTIAESAFLAGLPQAPGRYQRVNKSYIDLTPEEIESLNITDFDDLMSRSNEIKDSFVRGVFGQNWNFAGGKIGYIPGRFDYVLGQMLAKEFISESEAKQAKEEVKNLKFVENKVSLIAPHFVFYVQSQLEDILKEKYGDQAETILYQKGLKIYTTLDSDLQKTMQETFLNASANLDPYNIQNIAGVVLDSKTGAILAMQGSRDFNATEFGGHPFDGQVNVMTSSRQPGSTFKALVYAAAFEQKGLAPATVLMDVKTNLSLNGVPYFPKNFDNTFSGPVSIRKALGSSLNIPAVKAGIIIGIKPLYEFAGKLGIQFTENVNTMGPAMALGAPVVKPLEMAGAYATLANQGKKVTPFAITKVVDASGAMIYEQNMKAEQPQVISPETAFLVSDILSDESGKARPTSWNGSLGGFGRPVAVKTGTSTGVDAKGNTHPHDLWTIGYTPSRVLAVWAGNNKGWEGNPKGFLSDKASGLTNVAPIWRKIMLAVIKGVPAENFVRPAGVKQISVSKLSGKLLPQGFPESLIVNDYFNVKYLPDKQDTSLKYVKLEESSQKLPNEFTPESAVKEYVYVEFHSFFPNNPAWENPVRDWLTSNRATLSENLGIPNIIPFVPKETTEVYSEETQKNAPKITIVSPPNMGTVSPPRITITTNPSSPNGVAAVRIYWDGKIVAQKQEAPWTFIIPVEGTMVGSVHTIKAEVEDNLKYTGEISKQVKIGADTVPPKISFNSPEENTSIASGNRLPISIDAIDANSSIKRVTISIDGEVVKTFTTSPYQMNWKADLPAGTHVLEAIAHDEAENEKRVSLNFKITEVAQ